MNFKNFICNNCNPEEEGNNFLFVDSKNNMYGLYKKNINKADTNMKSIISSSDNNNSTNNLEIIEYPYSFRTNNDNNYNSVPHATLVKSNIEKSQKYNTYNHLIKKIEPPKLLAEHEKKSTTNNNENIPDSKYTPESSSLINNEDSVLNHKEFINNYNSNCHTVRTNKTANERILDKNEKNTKNNKDNNNIILSKMINKKINDIKIEYPSPESSKIFCINEDINLNFQEKKIDLNNSQKELSFKSEIKKKNYNTAENTLKSNTSFPKIKKIKNKNINIKNNSQNSQATINEKDRKFVKYSNKKVNIKKKMKNSTEKIKNKNHFLSMRPIFKTIYNKNITRLNTDNNIYNCLTASKKKYISKPVHSLIMCKSSSKNRTTITNTKRFLYSNESNNSQLLSKYKNRINNCLSNSYINPFSYKK